MRKLLLIATVSLLSSAGLSARPCLAEDEVDVEGIVSLLELVIDADADTAHKCLGVLTEKIQTHELSAESAKALRPRLEPLLRKILDGKADAPLYFDAALLAASWGDKPATAAVRHVLVSPNEEADRRRRALEALVAAANPQVLDDVAKLLSSPEAGSVEFRAAAIAALGRLEDGRVADVVLKSYPQLEPELQPKAVALLTQRTAWSKKLLEAIGRDALPATALNANQVAGLLARKDVELTRLVTAKWGTVRTARNPQREAVVVEMRKLLTRSPGDSLRGRKVFQKICGQCHKIYGQGQDVGPEITSNGRASFDQLLSNVFDPSLVIGAAYQARTVVTEDGRVLTGLLAEDNEQRIVLKTQGGKLETVPRDEIDAMKVSELSLMPEGLERQLKPEELADLFAFLSLDGPPEDAESKYIPGAPLFGEQ